MSDRIGSRRRRERRQVGQRGAIGRAPISQGPNPHLGTLIGGDQPRRWSSVHSSTFVRLVSPLSPLSPSTPSPDDEKDTHGPHDGGGCTTCSHARVPRHRDSSVPMIAPNTQYKSAPNTSPRVGWVCHKQRQQAVAAGTCVHTPSTATRSPHESQSNSHTLRALRAYALIRQHQVRCACARSPPQVPLFSYLTPRDTYRVYFGTLPQRTGAQKPGASTPQSTIAERRRKCDQCLMQAKTKMRASCPICDVDFCETCIEAAAKLGRPRVEGSGPGCQDAVQNLGPGSKTAPSAHKLAAHAVAATFDNLVPIAADADSQDPNRIRRSSQAGSLICKLGCSVTSLDAYAACKTIRTCRERQSRR